MSQYVDFSRRPTGFNAPSTRASFDETAAELLKHAEQVCEYLLPGGRREGHEYKSADLMGGRGDSLSINMKEGVWKDFATDDGGADLISLWASVRGLRPRDAKEEAEGWLGKAPAPKAGQRASWEDMTTTAPAAAPAAPKGKLPAPDRKWAYITEDGEVWCYVYRNEPRREGERKIVRPVLPDETEYKKPEGNAPLLNLPDIIDQAKATVVLVEGEKCSDAIDDLKAHGIVATTHIGGTNGVGKTDWSHLAGRNVVRWHDNDDAGRMWLKTTEKLLIEAGVRTIRDVIVSPKWPEKWDAADLPEAERRAALDEAMRYAPVFERRERALLEDSHMDVEWEAGEPETEFLLDNLIPCGRGGFFAALGGTGKGMIMMDLAAKVATPPTGGFDANPPLALGHKVIKHGRVVILSAEDDRDELRRRLRAMHPQLDAETRRRINFIAYPDAGDDRDPFFVIDQMGKLERTDEYHQIMLEMGRLEDLALVVLDPVSAFFRLDMTTNANSQFVGNMIDRMAKTLGCTVIACHHMTKGDAKHPIKTAEQARNAVQGGAQLLSSVRFGYAMWSPDEDKQKFELQKVGRDQKERNAVFMGGIVKANYPCSWNVETFIRHKRTGLLEVPKYEEIKGKEPIKYGFKASLVETAVHAISTWSAAGYPPERKAIVFSPGGRLKGAGEWLNLMSDRWQDELDDGQRNALINKLIRAKVVEETAGYLHLPGDGWTVDGEKTFKTDRKSGKPEEIAWLD